MLTEVNLRQHGIDMDQCLHPQEEEQVSKYQTILQSVMREAKIIFVCTWSSLGNEPLKLGVGVYRCLPLKYMLAKFAKVLGLCA